MPPKVKCKHISTLKLDYYTLNFVEVDEVALPRVGRSTSHSLVSFWKGEGRKLVTRAGRGTMAWQYGWC